MSVVSFLICFRRFYFFFQTVDFAKPIAFAWRPFFRIFNIILLSGFLGVFLSVFLHRISILCMQIHFSHVFGNFIF